MIAGGMTQIEIAKELQVSDQSVSNWKKIPEFAAAREEAERDAFHKLVPKARQKIAELLNAKNEQVQLAAARDILDRAGYKAESKVQLEGNLTTETTKLDGVLEQMQK